MKLDINKFSWSQLFSNNDGKTSGSGFLGVVIGITGCLVFILGSVDTIFLTKGSVVLNSAVTVIGIGAATLAARKFISKNDSEATQPDAPTPPEQPQVVE